MKLITGIHHIALNCHTPEKYAEEIRFYSEILGMEIVRTWKTGTMLNTGSGLMEIFNDAEAPLEQGTIRHFALATPNTDACVEAVLAAGYEVFRGPESIVIPSDPGFPARIAFCKGPLGEHIEFFQEL